MEGWWWEVARFWTGLCIEVLRKLCLVALTCTFVLCGAVIGSVSGALKGQTTETGLLRGAAIGAVAGVVVSLEVLDSCLQGELRSKVGILGSLVNGKIFREWVSPAILKAYQWQMNTIESGDGEVSDIFDTERNKGLMQDMVEKLPTFSITCCKIAYACSVCLQDLGDGETARRLPVCGHFFHVPCIDVWLLRHATCPVCRQVV